MDTKDCHVTSVKMLSSYEESCLVFAARYAHTRSTGAALIVVRTILSNWDRLSDKTKDQLKNEAMNEATCNHEEWSMIINKK